MRSGNWVLFILIVAAVAAGFIFSAPADSLAAKAKFEAGVTPSTLSLSVNAQGGITGTKTTTVDVHRIQVGSSYACNKIQTVEVLKGMDPLPPDAQQVLARYAGFSDRKGKCYFDTNITVQPFSDDEIRGVCQDVSSGTQGLVLDGLVTAWNKPSSYLDSIRNMRNKGGSGGVGPKNRTQVKFAAAVNCAAGGSGRIPGGFRVPTPQPGGVVIPSGGSAGSGNAQCDLTGTWYGYNNGTQTTGWKFNQIFTGGASITYRATHLSVQGAPTNSNDGAITRSSSGNYLFHTLLTKIPGANGSYQASTMRIYDADASCSKLTERQLYDSTSGRVNRSGNYWLQKAGAPPTPVPSPVGRPTGPSNRFRPRRAPTKPGDTYQPGPAPPKPGPNIPKWN